MNITEQSKQYLDHLANRKRNPAKPATLSAYRCYVKKWVQPYIGSLELDEFDNGSMKSFVETLVEKGLGASSIAGVTNVVKGIFKSCTDQNGNCIYPKIWNNDFIDAPPIEASEQEAPTVNRQQLEDIINKTEGQTKILYSLLAGTGLRIAESWALRKGPDNQKQSFWLPEDSLLIIRGQLRRGKFVPPKTSAGTREVDIHPELNELLKTLDRQDGKLLFTNRNGDPLRPMTVYKELTDNGLSGFHTFRRYRITHLTSCQAPDDLIKFWSGHGRKSSDMTSRYSKLYQNKQFRKEWSERVGIGFTIKKEKE